MNLLFANTKIKCQEKRGRNLLALSSPLAAVVLLDMIYVDKAELLLKHMLVGDALPNHVL